MAKSSTLSFLLVMGINVRNFCSPMRFLSAGVGVKTTFTYFFRQFTS